MTSPPTDYPANWRPRGAAQTAPSEAPVEALLLAIDSFVAALSEDNFAAMVQRTRG